MYESKNHAKYSLVVYIVFVVKYRHPLFIILSKGASYERIFKYIEN